MFGGSRAKVLAWAAPRGFAELALDADGPPANWRLFALARQNHPSGTLTVYIEGDGAPWSTPWSPPDDPTPLEPTALAMAVQDPAGSVVYLGRPCQYLTPVALASCDPALWMHKRFAPEVVATFDRELTRLQARLGTKHLRLVGYSGGGVIAALLAARRSDVQQLGTVAAPLALLAWTTWHDLSPFPDRSDPLHQSGVMPPSQHWVGQGDKVVPPSIVAQFIATKGGHMTVVQGYDHQCCWARDWAHLIAAEQSEGGWVWPNDDFK